MKPYPRLCPFRLAITRALIISFSLTKQDSYMQECLPDDRMAQLTLCFRVWMISKGYNALTSSKLVQRKSVVISRLRFCDDIDEFLRWSCQELTYHAKKITRIKRLYRDLLTTREDLLHIKLSLAGIFFFPELDNTA